MRAEDRGLRVEKSEPEFASGSSVDSPSSAGGRWTASFELSRGSRTSRINVVLPEPLTPVTHTSRPSGMAMVRSCRLCRLAWERVRGFVGRSPCRCQSATGRRVGMGICLRPLRYWPVSDSGDLRMSAWVP